MQASECMENFKVGLVDVKSKLRLIQSKLQDVDKHFYQEAQITLQKQEELMEIASHQRKLAMTRKFIVRVKKLD